MNIGARVRLMEDHPDAPVPRGSLGTVVRIEADGAAWVRFDAGPRGEFLVRAEPLPVWPIRAPAPAAAAAHPRYRPGDRVRLNTDLDAKRRRGSVGAVRDAQQANPGAPCFYDIAFDDPSIPSDPWIEERYLEPA